MTNIMKCPYCGSTALIKGGKTKRGTQRYECKYCGKRNSGDKSVIKLEYLKHSIKCVRCGSTNLKRAGYSHDKHNPPRYYCKDCNKKFVYRKTKKGVELLTNNDKRIIIMYTQNLSISAKKISEHLSLPYGRVLKYIKLYKGI